MLMQDKMCCGRQQKRMVCGTVCNFSTEKIKLCEFVEKQLLLYVVVDMV